MWIYVLIIIKKKQEFDGGITFLKNSVYEKCKDKIKFDSKSKIEIY